MEKIPDAAGNGAGERMKEDVEMQPAPEHATLVESDAVDDIKNEETLPTGMNSENECFRIVVQNLPRYFGFKQLKKWFTNLGLNASKVKPTQGKGRRGAVVSCYLTFRTKEEVDDAIRKISTTPFSGTSLTAKTADAAPEPSYRGRQPDQKRPPPSTKPPEEEILDIVTNLHHLNYEDQLKSKQNHAMEILRKIDKKFNSNAQGSLPWLKTTKGHLCPLDSIKPSPESEKYRNKCEFSIGLAPNGDRTIGFKLGKYREGIFWVCAPDACLHINDLMKHLVKVFEEFIRTSTMEPYDDRARQGHWHQLTVRTNKVGQSMICLHLHPQDLTSDELGGEKQRLRKHCEALPTTARPTSVYWVLDDKTMSGPRRSQRMEEEMVFGEQGATFGEQLLGYQFKISPDAFFQVNTSAAEVLYSTIVDAAMLTPKSVVLDLCCGTGTIGILMAKHAKKVYGIELGEAAVADAIHNAKTNQVDNIEFICAKVEDALENVLTKLEPDDDVVVILDPPRNGVHNNVVDTLRKQLRINRLLYVACAADNEFTISNLYGLCRNRAKFERGGEVPFVPARCIPVDLFPQTKNVELVFIFDRLNKED